MAQLFRPVANVWARFLVALSVLLPLLVILMGSAISRSQPNTHVDTPPDQPVPFSHKHHAVELGIDCRFCHTGVEKSSFAGLPQSETCMVCHSQIWTNSPLLEPVRKSYESGVPIKWNKVNKVPEFVYFNHSIHVKKGVNCNNCHGKVNEMQYTFKGRAFFMNWCLECHRNPEKFLYKDTQNPDLSPRQQVFRFYKKLQMDPHGDKMLPQEQLLRRGESQMNDKDMIAEGEKLVKERGIKTAQLADCSVCHR